MANVQSPNSDYHDLIRRLELALDASQMGVWEHNLARDELVWDAQMHRIYRTGRTDRQVSADAWQNAIHPDDRQRANDDFAKAIGKRGRYDSQFRILLPDGEVRHLRSRGHYYLNDAGEPSVIGAEWDVTEDVALHDTLQNHKVQLEQRARELADSYAEIEHAAQHDYLTGLPNRHFFDARLHALQADDQLRSLAVLHLDLDRFKQINDSHGHAAGDHVLRVAASRIIAACPQEAVAARTGGDEFVIVLTDFSSTDALETIARRIQKALSEPVAFGNDMLRSGVSIGIAYTLDAHRSVNLLTESDVALYQAKRLGRSRIAFFDPALQDELSERRTLALELQEALDRREVQPHYQVQVDAATGAICGLEALVRWNHPSRGLLSPFAFLAVAQEAGLSNLIDAAVLDHVLEDRARWRAQGLSVPRIAVNVSASRLHDAELLTELERRHIDFHGIAFELVETIFLDESSDEILDRIRILRSLGIEIELDDFGSGHASLLGLVKIRPDRLKIDRNLVKDVVVSVEQRRILKSIIQIAQTLKVGVVAEGIETRQHAEALRRLGCDVFQGYHFGRPEPAEAVAKRLSPHNPSASGRSASSG
ncbi:putative bifunctional diguanylate cyclase/phosphodiesterase [Neorhizobium sp. NPDC001467]|uniref:putative bifunctional diguanylate cyclase/phosphodiesterase n=1 Tax=Neorhizobium sp. NPDC001467 TaxID=3390595 RepID=UPI003CFEB428